MANRKDMKMKSTALSALASVLFAALSSSKLTSK